MPRRIDLLDSKLLIRLDLDLSCLLEGLLLDERDLNIIVQHGQELRSLRETTAA